ncbi:hypothetical protein V8D89_007359, partial [Ganoderma adspersum]
SSTDIRTGWDIPTYPIPERRPVKTVCTLCSRSFGFAFVKKYPTPIRFRSHFTAEYHIITRSLHAVPYVAVAHRFFDQLDAQRKGYLLSDVAVPFFGRAKLPNDIMATIWDMADSEHDGQLTRDDFAVAMHLIRQKLAGKELPTPAPAPAVVSPTPSRPSSIVTPPRRASMPMPGEALSHRASVSSQQPLQPVQLDPTTVRLPDDVDDDLRSDTPPPPYELIAPDAT